MEKKKRKKRKKQLYDKFKNKKIKKCITIHEQINKNINNDSLTNEMSINNFIELCYLYFIKNCENKNKKFLFEELKEEYNKLYEC